MQRLLIHLINALILVLILLGLPAVTSLDLGHWRLNARQDAAHLLLGVLAGTGFANIAAAWFFRGTRKARGNGQGRNPTHARRQACLHWAGVFLLLGAAAWLQQEGHLSFDWLKRLLR